MGMQALIFKAHVEKGVVVEPGATIIGVTVAAGRYLPARAVVTTQEVADRLAELTYILRAARYQPEHAACEPEPGRELLGQSSRRPRALAWIDIQASPLLRGLHRPTLPCMLRVFLPRTQPVRRPSHGP